MLNFFALMAVWFVLATGLVILELLIRQVGKLNFGQIASQIKQFLIRAGTRLFTKSSLDIAPSSTYIDDMPNRNTPPEGYRTWLDTTVYDNPYTEWNPPVRPIAAPDANVLYERLLRETERMQADLAVRNEQLIRTEEEVPRTTQENTVLSDSPDSFMNPVVLTYGENEGEYTEYSNVVVIISPTSSDPSGFNYALPGDIEGNENLTLAHPASNGGYSRRGRNERLYYAFTDAISRNGEDDTPSAVFNNRTRRVEVYSPWDHVGATTRDGSIVWVGSDNVSRFRGVAYVDTNAMYAVCGARYCDECGNTHTDDACRENLLYRYHRMSPMNFANYDVHAFTVGVEIEKEDDEFLSMEWAETLRDRTGWVKEGDSSLCPDTGFELTSPIMGLNLDAIPEDTLERFNLVKNYIDEADASKACGGHISVGSRDHNGYQLYDMISGYWPVLYAMYPNRSRNEYSRARTKYDMRQNPEKHDAFNPTDVKLELRIFPRVTSLAQILWRINLIRLMLANPTEEEEDAILWASQPTHPIGKHLREVYTDEKIVLRIFRMIEAVQRYESRDFRSSFIETLVGRTAQFARAEDDEV